MLTADQISALSDRSEQLLDPVINFLIEDIARRVKEAGQLTGTASYQTWRLQNLGMSQRQLKKEIAKRLEISLADAEKLLTQAAETGYNFDLSRFPNTQAIPLSANSSLQQILAATVAQAREDLTNMTQTMGFVGADGICRPLTQAYQQACDFAFQKISTGAQDYVSAIRDATWGLAENGIRTIDYKSGYHISIEAAVRQNMMGGMGIMQNHIAQNNHDTLGCNGWEISAHENSAPDHEPIQGKQYSDAEYEALNNSLTRRIGTLHCGHYASPIILGVHSPQYTDEELEDMRRRNEEGVTFDGRHYTGFEATQRQRKFERSIRKQQRRILIDETVEDTAKLQTDQIRLQRLKQEYKRFSDGVGLPMQYERLDTAGFTWKHAKAAQKVANVAVPKNKLAKAYAEENSSIEWPQKGENISTEQYKSLRNYAESKGIQVQGFKNSDVDVELATNAIDKAASVLDLYPELRGSEKRPFSVYLDGRMKSGDFGEVKEGAPHILHLNADAYRNKTALAVEYKKLADESWFVKGTEYESIVYHEMGHMISDVYGINGLDIVKKVINTNSSVEALLWCKENLSEYSFQYDGREIIAEMYSAYFGLPSPGKEVIDFVARCDKIISERRLNYGSK